MSSFESEFEAFDLMNHLQDVIKTLPKDQLVSIYLHVAAILALQPNQYTLEFAGFVVLKNEKKLGIYRVRRSVT